MVTCSYSGDADFRRSRVGRCVFLLYKYAPFAILYLLTAFFHVLQSSEQV
jgi:hypothetical protein